MNPNFHITRVKRKPYFKMAEPHFHSFYEIYYLSSGKRRFFINDTIYNISKGELLFIQKGDLHRTTYDSSESHERMVINFTDQFIEEFIKKFDYKNIRTILHSTHINVPLSRRSYIEDLFHKMEQEEERKDDFSSYLQEKYLCELLIFMIRFKESTNALTEDITVEDETIQSAARYICKHFNKALTLEGIADHFNMSPTYFSKKFKAITGFGFKEYLINVRLKEASHLLLNTKKPITEIALSCGFNDSNYFGDIFKRTKGIPPTKYRKYQA